MRAAGAMMHQQVAGIPVSEEADDDRYFRTEWALFAGDPTRERMAREAVAGRRISRVLDIGCGAGQQLRPFVVDGQAFGVGIDVSPVSGAIARRLFAADLPGRRVAFARAAAEHLPFASASFDLVVCRLVLPYTHNASALAEMARVLTPEGALLLKFHHARYYTLKLREAVGESRIKSAIHACRVLTAGTVYHLFGVQPRGRLLGRETYQTLWLLRRELQRHGLELQRMLPDSVPAAPSLLVSRSASR